MLPHGVEIPKTVPKSPRIELEVELPLITPLLQRIRLTFRACPVGPVAKALIVTHSCLSPGVSEIVAYDLGLGGGFGLCRVLRFPSSVTTE